MELYLIAFAGLILHWLGVIDSAIRKSDFDWKYFIQLNLYRFIMTAVATALIIYTKDEFATWFPITKLSAFFAGYLSGDIFHRVLKAFRERASKIK